MDLGKSLEIVHRLATQQWLSMKDQYFSWMLQEPLESLTATKEALDTVEDFIVNNFEEE